MRSYSALFAAFLIVLLAAPAAPLAAGTGTPAAPAAASRRPSTSHGSVSMTFRPIIMV